MKQHAHEPLAPGEPRGPWSDNRHCQWKPCKTNHCRLCGAYIRYTPERKRKQWSAKRRQVFYPGFFDQQPPTPEWLQERV